MRRRIATDLENVVCVAVATLCQHVLTMRIIISNSDETERQGAKQTHAGREKVSAIATACAAAATIRTLQAR